MPRVLIAGDSMVRFVSQHFPSRRGMSVEASAHSGARIENLLPEIAERLAGVDLVIVHVARITLLKVPMPVLTSTASLLKAFVEVAPLPIWLFQQFCLAIRGSSVRQMIGMQG